MHENGSPGGVTIGSKRSLDSLLDEETFVVDNRTKRQKVIPADNFTNSVSGQMSGNLKLGSCVSNTIYLSCFLQ